SNVLSHVPRAPILCAGPTADDMTAQAKAVEAIGGTAVRAEAGNLETGPVYGGVIWWGDMETARTMEQTLARRTGPIVPLITGQPDRAHVLHERHVCVDTTASGGNAALLSAAG
ncbi:MAG: hypothetical protein AAFY39_19850, partial [Pseudomonadota bacterium]